MKRCRYILFIVIAMMSFSQVFAQSVSGQWVTVDDKTGKQRSIIRLNESGGKVSGTLVKVFKQSGDTGICSKCPGNFKNKRIQGLTILWGLKKTGDNTWGGGKILDPKSGKVYNAKITLKGNKLYVRGYLGMSMFGRTQVWHRK